MKEYALFKGEQMVAIGTVEEIAEERGVKPKTIQFYMSKVYQRRAKSEVNNRLQLIKLED
ncbi:LuxR C-terminal-related transcriptional regulator [Lysinibacillus sp. CD3-6]|uniref:LuxR C-terminal-related transcriptional regulator n=1 Tax=Lysinibacillus sp. CD3-6 TaxID=2892541 RepID=UPI001172592D|nr:LuxR C-terminal-related transcriptional regulator [Lysinibacillus sp. CD3-6]UED81062.1 LuxR C-terminal-related transcriptional regulator [Lysinibacillus sp. CD3-6]